MAILKIKDLVVSVEGKTILKGINLEINEGENHALVGPNGNGKSTLLKILMGHPAYEVESGSVEYDGQDLLELEVEERSLAGMFLVQQYPSSVPGVKNSEFLKTAMDAHSENGTDLLEFKKTLASESKKLGIKTEQNDRYLNVGFSGGEKKKNEILQMNLLKPKFALVDEIDSGLDVDALQSVAKALQDAHANGATLLTVSHYERLYSMIKPSHVHIILDGKIVQSGNYDLVKKIDSEGYDWIKGAKELDLGDL